MALIKCPHCGNSVSDTASNCIHCGNSITSRVEADAAVKQIEFTELSGSEKSRLQEEFERAYPNQKNYEAREAKLKKIKKASTICVVVGAAIALLIFIFARNSLNTFALFGLVFGLGLFFVSDVIDIICPFLIRRNKKKSLVALKMFQKWLKDRKGINYKVIFNEADRKWKNYFDGINVTAEGYKG